MSRPDYYSIKMISNSGLKHFAHNSPFKALWLLENGLKETDALIEGRACHKAILEPETFFDEFEYIPESITVETTNKKTGEVTQKVEAYHGNKKVFKDKIKEIQESGRTPLKPSQKEMIDSLCNRFFSSKNAVTLLKGCEPEKEYYGELFGKEFKVKVDAINEEKGYIIDLKTCTNADPDECLKKIHELDYDQQGWIYPEIASQFTKKPITKFFFIFIEKSKPNSMCIIEMSKVMFDIGREKAIHAMALYKYALKNPTKDHDSLPQGQKHFQYELPDWMVRKYNLEGED